MGVVLAVSALCACGDDTGGAGGGGGQGGGGGSGPTVTGSPEIEAYCDAVCACSGGCDADQRATCITNTENTPGPSYGEECQAAYQRARACSLLREDLCDSIEGTLQSCLAGEPNLATACAPGAGGAGGG
jgi:hypothetical protein